MSLVMRGPIFEKVLVFIDDTLVLGKDFDDHLHNLELVFERFRKSGLKLKPKKCRIFLRRAKILGHVVSERGVEMDPDKVACIVAWEFLKDVSELVLWVFQATKKVKKERIVLREIYLRTTGRHLSIGSHSITCYPTELTIPTGQVGTRFIDPVRMKG